MTETKIATIARKLGGFYETGAWRFPSVWAKDEFVRLTNAG